MKIFKVPQNYTSSEIIGFISQYRSVSLRIAPYHNLNGSRSSELGKSLAKVLTVASSTNFFFIW